MSYDEFVAEYGSTDDRRSSLKSQFAQYAESEDEMWERLEQENNESLERWIATGRQY